MSTLIIGGVDVSDYISPSDMQVDYANKYGDSITTDEGKEVAKIIGQEITLSVKLNLVGDGVLNAVKTAAIGKQDITVQAFGVPEGDYKITAFKQTLAYQTNVRYWDINITLSCYIVSDGL